jgi:hypothetical protein
MTSAITAFVVEFHCYTFVSFSRVRSCLLEEEIFDIILLLDEDMQKQVQSCVCRGEVASQYEN